MIEFDPSCVEAPWAAQAPERCVRARNGAEALRDIRVGVGGRVRTAARTGRAGGIASGVGASEESGFAIEFDLTTVTGYCKFGSCSPQN
jgi:hypothetical protein